MKLNFVLLATSILQTCAQEMGVDCFTKSDCKLTKIIKDAQKSENVRACAKTGTRDDVAKCISKALGLNNDQVDLAFKIAPYARKCVPLTNTEFYNCTTGCTELKDRDDCLENCTLPSKVKSEECLAKSAGKSTQNATESAKCLYTCDYDTYAEIFDCQYKCQKDVYDALAAKSSGFSGYQAISLAKVSLSVLAAYLFI
jgi:hypothetical protein